MGVIEVVYRGTDGLKFDFGDTITVNDENIVVGEVKWLEDGRILVNGIPIRDDGSRCAGIVMNEDVNKNTKPSAIKWDGLQGNFSIKVHESILKKYNIKDKNPKTKGGYSI